LKLYIRELRPRTPWTFPISIYRDYKWDTDDILRKLFEEDMRIIKCPKMTDEEKEEV